MVKFERRKVKTEEIDERIFELKKAAITCGIDPDCAVDDLAEACGVAGQVVPDSEEHKSAKWWPVFLKDYSVRCIGRWQMKCSKLSNHEAMEEQWRELFEPMWLLGCKYIKDLAIQNVRDSYNKVASTNAKCLSDQDLRKIKQYCNSVSDDLDTVISTEIKKFTVLQRETLLKVIRQINHHNGIETK